MSDHPWQKYRAQAKAEEIDAKNQVANHTESQAAEIARLRAELATAQVEAFKKAAEIARQFAQSEGWSGTSALRLRNCIIAEAAIYTKTGGKDE